MPQFSVRIVGADKLQIGFKRFATAIQKVTKDALREAMKRAKKRSVSDPAGGPYSVPERGYQRTGNLSASTFLVEDGLSFRIESNAMRDGRPYSAFVIGNADGGGQAAVHDGWWTPLRTSVDDEMYELTRTLDDDYGEAAREAGLE